MRGPSILIDIEKITELLELPEEITIQQAWIADLGGGEYALRFSLYREVLIDDEKKDDSRDD